MSGGNRCSGFGGRSSGQWFLWVLKVVAYLLAQRQTDRLTGWLTTHYSVEKAASKFYFLIDPSSLSRLPLASCPHPLYPHTRLQTEFPMHCNAIFLSPSIGRLLPNSSTSPWRSSHCLSPCVELKSALAGTRTHSLELTNSLASIF